VQPILAAGHALVHEARAPPVTDSAPGPGRAEGGAGAPPSCGTTSHPRTG